MDTARTLKRNSNSWTAFRLTPEGQTNSMIHVRSCGFYDVPAGWQDHERHKNFLELFWCVSGELEFCCGKHRWRLTPGEVCYYMPGDLHMIRAVSGETSYFWLTVDGPDVRQLVEAFGITRETRMCGKCPSSLFCQLRDYITGHTYSGELLGGAVAFEIISRSFIQDDVEQQQLFRQFAAYVEQNLENPGAGVGACADMLKCHRSTLTRCVKQVSGLSPMEYLLAARLRTALTLLRDSSLSIKEIAARCGFNDPGYFARVITRQYGTPPHELRG